MNTETVFWAFAIVGTTFFLLRAILMYAGIGDDVDLNHDVSAGGTEHSMHIVSVNSVLAFAMTFGWSGLAALNEFGFTLPMAVASAFGVGALCMVGTAYLFSSVMRLQTEGANFELKDLIGKRTSVYERIPKGGVGRIQLNVGGMIREVRAVSDAPSNVESFQMVEVVDVVDTETVSVKPIN